MDRMKFDKPLKLLIFKSALCIVQINTTSFFRTSARAIREAGLPVRRIPTPGSTVMTFGTESALTHH